MSNFNRTLRSVLKKPDRSDFVVVASSIYAANDSVGGPGKVFYSTGGGLILRGVSVRDNSKQNAALKLYLYRSTPTTTAVDHDEWIPVSADADLEIGTVTIAGTDYVDETNYSKVYKEIAAPNGEVDESSVDSFDVVVKTTGTPTYAAVTDLKIEFVYWID
jgi:hypothetical protein